MDHDYAPAIHVSVSDPTGLPNEVPVITLMYGLSPSSALSSVLVTDTGYTLNYTHHTLPYSRSAYYYADIMVGDKRTITSPVWYTRTDAPPASVYETFGSKNNGNLFSIVTNPVADDALLQTIMPYNGEVYYTIRSATGAALKSGIINNPNPYSRCIIPVSDLPHGFYIIQLEGKSIRQAIKFIK